MSHPIAKIFLGSLFLLTGAITLSPPCLGADLNPAISSPKSTVLKDQSRNAYIAQVSAEDYYNAGLAKFNAGNILGAITDYSQAIQLNPNYADAYYDRGTAQNMVGNTQDGAADLQKASQLFQQQGNPRMTNEVPNILDDLIKELRGN